MKTMTVMTVGELIKTLVSYPEDLPIVLQKDPEGNGFSPLDGAEPCMYEASPYGGEVYPTDSQIDNGDFGYTDEDRAPEGSIEAVVLWPMI